MYGVQTHRSRPNEIICKKEAKVQVAESEKNRQGCMGTTSAGGGQSAVRVCNVDSNVGYGPSTPLACI